MRQVAGRPSGKKNSIPGWTEEGVRGVAGEVAVGLEVAERECLWVGAALERDPRELADGAVRAVAAGQVASTHIFRPPV